MGVYIILKEGALPDDDPQDIGVLIEGVEVLRDLSSIAQACALLFGLILFEPELPTRAQINFLKSCRRSF